MSAAKATPREVIERLGLDPHEAPLPDVGDWYGVSRVAPFCFTVYNSKRVIYYVKNGTQDEVDRFASVFDQRLANPDLFQPGGPLHSTPVADHGAR
jgi:hypothetical protein